VDEVRAPVSLGEQIVRWTGFDKISVGLVEDECDVVFGCEG
jgi:hypothetical protein